MTPSPDTPDEQTLTNEQIDAFEIEMRKQFIMSHPGLMLNLSRVCATVRQLRAQRADQDEINLEVSLSNQALLSQLEQLRAENERFTKSGCKHCGCTCDGCAPCGDEVL